MVDVTVDAVAVEVTVVVIGVGLVVVGVVVLMVDKVVLAVVVVGGAVLVAVVLVFAEDVVGADVVTVVVMVGTDVLVFAADVVGVDVVAVVETVGTEVLVVTSGEELVVLSGTSTHTGSIVPGVVPSHCIGNLLSQASRHPVPSHDGIRIVPSWRGTQPSPAQQSHEQSPYALIVAICTMATRPMSIKICLLNMTIPVFVVGGAS